MGKFLHHQTSPHRLAGVIHCRAPHQAEEPGGEIFLLSKRLGVARDSQVSLLHDVASGIHIPRPMRSVAEQGEIIVRMKPSPRRLVPSSEQARPIGQRTFRLFSGGVLHADQISRDSQMEMVRSLLTLPCFRGFLGGFLFGLDGLGFEKLILISRELLGGFDKALHACDSCLGADKNE